MQGVRKEANGLKWIEYEVNGFKIGYLYGKPKPPWKRSRTYKKRPSKAVTAPTENLQPDPEVEHEEDYELSQGKKRVARNPAGEPTKGKGKAKAKFDTLFDKLPTDVLYKIFIFLNPLDLLRLARTNQMLRSHLMSKASASIWKEARGNVYPPILTCPSDQSEPQWAALLFSKDG
ncbi:hypothetical protein FRC04_003450 [Tulasnella sp. 424]|nr:hypothetical protein FRC04_003450 [Tulasnella sp. 424]KAG8965769.1 hypothetical protein FRC05_003028 [Tulasnella sp. 425]